MKSSFPFICAFSVSLVSGTLVALTASNWLTVWLGLELNLISFLPLITIKGSAQQTESAIKYFLIQALGSGLVLLGGLRLSLIWSLWGSIFVLSGLSLKLGAAPLHFWLPMVINGISWLNCLILATWQKIAPLFLLFSLTHLTRKPAMLLASLSAIIGGLGGINQTSLRALIAYSSIGHIGWLILLAQTSSFSVILYFSIYVSITLPIFLFLWISDTTHLSKTSSIKQISSQYIVSLCLLLISLGGVPPLTGFVAKWFALQRLIYIRIPASIILIAGALISLYYYLALLFALVINSSGSSHIQVSWSAIPASQLILLMFPVFGIGLLTVC